MKRFFLLTVEFLILFAGFTINAQIPTRVGWWKFDDPSNMLKAEIGSALQISGTQLSVDGPNTINKATQIGIGSYLKMTHGIAANGGGIMVNNYSVQIDFSIPTTGIWYSFIQTDPTNVSDADLFIKTNNAIGTAVTGYSTNTIATNSWYRMVITVQNGTLFNVYINGDLWLNGTIQAIDGRFALSNDLLLFADNDGDDATINCSELGIWDVVLTPSEVSKLGNASSAVIKKALTIPVIDGTIEPIWASANTYSIDKFFRTETPTLGPSGTTSWKGLWTNDGIYILLQVNDDVFFPAYSGANPNSNWAYDLPEIYFDVNPVLADGLGSSNLKGHYQISLPFLNGQVSGTPSTDADGVINAFFVNNPTYVAEYFIPFSKLVDMDGFGVPKYATMGFDVTINDRDNEGIGRQRAVWSNIGNLNESYIIMDDCGTITLEGAVPGILVTGITVSTADGSSSITTEAGTLQMMASVMPVNADDPNVHWSVINGTGKATISSTGLVTAILNGTVFVTAKSSDGGRISDTKQITISNQVASLEDLNILKDGDFTSGTLLGLPWTAWSGNGGIAEIINGICTMRPMAASENWQLQVNQKDWKVYNDSTYVLTFTAWADADRTFNIDFEDPGNSYNRFGSSTDPQSKNGRSEWIVPVSTTPKTFSFRSTIDAAQINTVFLLNIMTSNDNPTVYIDKIYLVSETQAPPSITINQSLKGRYMQSAELQTIQWNSLNINQNVNIQFSTDSGQNWVTTASGVPSSNGNNSVTISTPNVPGIMNNCMLRVVSTDGAVSATSEVFTILSANTFAGGSGTQAEPFLIASPEHLNNVRLFLGSSNSWVNFQQIAPVDLGVAPWNQGEGWDPIGDATSKFYGKYNGNGYYITGLTINRPTEDYNGLFGWAVGSEFSFLGIINVNITGKERAGALAGKVESNGNVFYCYSAGNIQGGSWLGGLVANLYYGSTMNNCQSSANIQTNNFYQIGGLVGRLVSSSITKSFATGKVEGKGDYTGGLVGMVSDYSSITDCYATGLVTGKESIGGLLGYHYYGSTLTNSYSTGGVISSGMGGGLIGSTNGGVVSNCYWNSETSNQSISATGEAKNTNQMTLSATFQTWAFGSTWSISEGFTYPYLKWQVEPGTPGLFNYPPSFVPPANLIATRNSSWISLDWQAPSIGSPTAYNIYRDGLILSSTTSLNYSDGSVSNYITYKYEVSAVYGTDESAHSNSVEIFLHTGFSGGDGTELNPYLVSNAGELNTVRLYPTAYFKQINNIDLGSAPWNTGKGWKPIGSISSTFTGSYDGNGYTINNLTINRPYEDYVGLFGFSEGIYIKNLSVNGSITGNDYVGAIVGENDNNSQINNQVNATVSGRDYVGGIVGISYATSINKSTSSGTINSTGNYSGGLVGGLYISGIINNSSSNMVTSSSGNYIGGIIGTTEQSTVSNSFFSGSVAGNYYVGGITGFVNYLGIVNTCYSIGTVSGTTNVGGVVGKREYAAKVLSSYWNTETSGTVTSAGGEGRTTDEMTYTYGANTYVGWDFTYIWADDSGYTMNNGYPFLAMLDVSIPTVETGVSSLLTGISANVDGTVTSDGGVPVTSRGICWSIARNPSINDKVTYAGSGTGFFTGTPNFLAANTTYYARAFATNSVGTGYGFQVSFTTTSVVPEYTCSDNFYDSGEGVSDYSNGEDYTRVFYPGTPGDKVSLTFSSFSTEETFDFLYIFDGPDQSYPQFQGSPFTGLQSLGTIVASSENSSGAITIQFTSDQSVTDLGWSATISCVPQNPLNYLAVNAENFSGSYTDLDANGVVIPTSNFDDSNSSPQEIGFSFKYNSQIFTQFILNTNGFIKLGNSEPATWFFNAATASNGGIFKSTNPADVNLISPFNHDLTSGAGAEYRVHTSGTAPDRICTIQFKNVRDKTATPVEQYDNMQFQIKLYETSGIIEFVYGDWAPSANLSAYKSAACGLKGSGVNDNQILIASKTSNLTWDRAAFSNGYSLGSYLGFGNPTVRPKPDIGRTFRFVPVYDNNLKVSEIYSMGNASRYYSSPQSVSVIILNTGRNKLVNIPVTLTVSGANNYTNTQYISSIDSGKSILVVFSDFTATSTGSTNIAVTLPNDDYNSDNTKTWLQNTTDYNLNYSTSEINSARFGFTAADAFDGIMYSKYHVSGSANVNSVDAFITNEAYNTGKTVFGIVLNQAGAIIGQSDNYIIQPGDLGTWHSFAINNTPTVTDAYFYSGFALTNAGIAYYAIGAQAEKPCRTNAFYESDIDGSGLIEVDTIIFGNRFMIGATLSPILPVAGTASSNSSICTGNSISISLSGYLGNIQWQQSSDGSTGWTNVLTGTGSNSSSYNTGNLFSTTYFRAEVTQPLVSPVYSNVIIVTVNQLPVSPGTISGTAVVCQGQNSVSYSVPVIANSTSYVWTIPVGASGSSTSNSISINYGASAVSGDITVKGNNTCGTSSTSTLPVSVNSLPGNAGTINGMTSVCQGQNAVGYTLPDIANATSYIWTLPGGASGTSTTNSITVNYGLSAVSGNIIVKGNSACGAGAASSLPIVINNLPEGAGSISGLTSVCQGQNSVTFTVPAITGANSYSWSLPGDASGTSSTNSIIVSFGTSAISGNIGVKGVNSCGDGTISNLAVIVDGAPANAGTISGATTVNQGQTAVVYSVPLIAGATSYVWTLPSGVTGTSSTNSISVDFSSGFTFGSIEVYGHSNCGNGNSSVIAVSTNSLPPAAGVINGLTAVCQNQNSVVYAVPTIANATSYIWTLPDGATGISTTNIISVNYTANAISGNITVKGHNQNGDGAASSLVITINPLPASVGTISGPAIVCKGQNSVAYSVQTVASATSYVWTLPVGATGTSTTKTINIDFGSAFASGVVEVKGQNTCGLGVVSIIAVSGNSLPGNAGTIAGPASICKGQADVTFTVPAISDASSYAWTLPAGATGTSSINSINVSFSSSFTSGGIEVFGQNTCGDGGVSVIPVTGNPLPGNAGNIAGPTTVCPDQGSTFSYAIPVIPNASSYLWTLPLGASGTSSTNIISVNYEAGASSGNIIVKGHNSCGDGASSSRDIIVSDPYKDQEICIVTIDLETGKNMVVWEKSFNEGIVSYNIYREGTVQNSWDLIGTVPFNELSVFVDTGSIPEQEQYLYKISIVDTCGNESVKSPWHKTMLLQYVSNNNGVNLKWEKYEVESGLMNFASYDIFRGSDSIALSKLTTISSSKLAYVDLTPDALDKRMYYRVGGVKADTCDPVGISGKKASSGPFLHSLSNLEDNRLKSTGISKTLADEIGLMVYPNPFTDLTTINYTLHKKSGVKVEVYNVVGEKIKVIFEESQTSGSHKIEMKAIDVNYQPGIYYLKIYIDDNVVIKKTMLTR
jgi:hypothetical protein